MTRAGTLQVSTPYSGFARRVTRIALVAAPVFVFGFGLCACQTTAPHGWVLQECLDIRMYIPPELASDSPYNDSKLRFFKSEDLHLAVYRGWDYPHLRFDRLQLVTIDNRQAWHYLGMRDVAGGQNTSHRVALYFPVEHMAGTVNPDLPLGLVARCATEADLATAEQIFRTITFEED